jgi:hypothetical protein
MECPRPRITRNNLPWAHSFANRSSESGPTGFLGRLLGVRILRWRLLIRRIVTLDQRKSASLALQVPGIPSWPLTLQCSLAFVLVSLLAPRGAQAQCGPEPFVPCSAAQKCFDGVWNVTAVVPNGTSCSTLPGGLGRVGICESPNPKGKSPVSTCTPMFTVGGTVSGLLSGTSITLQEFNGGPTVMVPDGPFQFKDVLDGTPYQIKTLHLPSGVSCAENAAASGRVNNASVSGVRITCTQITRPTTRFAVTTYHYDNLRTGWNQSETVLTPTNVQSGNFGILFQQGLPDNADVDAQPLVVSSQTITTGAPPGQTDIPGLYPLLVYVVTEANDVYAVDANTGKVVLSANLGTPFIGPSGISSTPVIDLAANTMFVVTYADSSISSSSLCPSPPTGNPIYQIHALDLGNLTEKVMPLPDTSNIANTATDVATTTAIPFCAGIQGQHPALLESHGNVYAAFGSLGDNQGARGWVLGWSVPSLTPLAYNQLNNRLSKNLSTTFHGGPNTPSGLFLSSVWMSGYGVAADATGDLYFVTGNSTVDVSDVNPNPSNGDLAGELGKLHFDLLSEYQGFPQYGNIADSVVRLRPDLSGIDDGSNAMTGAPGDPTRGIFTPWMQNGRDVKDTDFGSGGAMLLPDQAGSRPHLLAAAGKEGVMYLLDRDQLGGFGQPSVYGLPGATDSVLAEVNIGQCWCGPSYFNSGHHPQIVSSGGSTVELWSLRASPLGLSLEGKSAPIGAGVSTQGMGFFTSVSSDGNRNAIIWALGPDMQGQVSLYGFNALPDRTGTLPPLFPPFPLASNGHNVVPVVANGKVFVATDGLLTVFGLGASGQGPVPQPPSGVSAALAWGHRLTGNVMSIKGNLLQIETREKRTASIDVTQAVTHQRAYMGLHVGAPITAFGQYDAKSVLQAETVLRARIYPAWPADR